MQRDYYKEVAHKIIKADKSQDMQGKQVSWRPRRVKGAAPVQRPEGSTQKELSPRPGEKTDVPAGGSQPGGILS